MQHSDLCTKAGLPTGFLTCNRDPDTSPGTNIMEPEREDQVKKIQFREFSDLPHRGTKLHVLSLLSISRLSPRTQGLQCTCPRPLDSLPQLLQALSECLTWKRRTVLLSIAAGTATLCSPHRPRKLELQEVEVLPFRISGPVDLEG